MPEPELSSQYTGTLLAYDIVFGISLGMRLASGFVRTAHSVVVVTFGWK